MNRKVVIFSLKGETMCFVHSLLNTLNLKEKGYDVKLVIAGRATQQVKELSDPEKSFANLYERAKKAGVIDCVCKACSALTKSLESAKKQGLPICGEMSGHPSMYRYMEEGYEVVVF